MSCPQIWNVEQKKRREKEKVGGRPAKLNEKKGDRDLEPEIKNEGDIFLLEEQHENFVTAVTKWKMLAVTNARWKWATVKKKWTKKTCNQSPIYTAENFWRGLDESGTRTKKILLITHLHVLFSTVLNDVKLLFGTGKRLNISASVLDSCLVRMLLPL